LNETQGSEVIDISLKTRRSFDFGRDIWLASKPRDQSIA